MNTVSTYLDALHIGRLKQLILSERERNEQSKPDPAALVATFERCNCPRTAQFIRRIENGSYGNSVFQAYVLRNGRVFDKSFEHIRVPTSEIFLFSIGDDWHNISTLEWLGYFATLIETLPEEMLTALNETCGLIMDGRRGFRFVLYLM